MFLDSTLPLKVWQLRRLSCGTPHRLQGYEPVNKRTIVTLIIAHIQKTVNNKVYEVCQKQEACCKKLDSW